jgi:hypothetical protein
MLCRIDWHINPVLLLHTCQCGVGAECSCKMKFRVCWTLCLITSFKHSSKIILYFSAFTVTYINFRLLIFCFCAAQFTWLTGNETLLHTASVIASLLSRRTHCFSTEAWDLNFDSSENITYESRCKVVHFTCSVAHSRCFVSIAELNGFLCGLKM